MKYVNTGVVFQEVPDEVTLSINISNCPCHCIGCHSQYLWDDIGEPLNVLSLNLLLEKYGSGITCVCFMGGDADVASVNDLAAHVRRSYPKLKVAWYSGRTAMAEEIDLGNFDYIKLGPYVEELGGLAKKTTNQRMYRVGENRELQDITQMFWK